MNLNNSSSAVSSNQSSPTDDLPRSVSFFIRYKLIFLIILALVILLLSILIFLFILKCTRKTKKKIQRQNVIIRKDFEPKTDTTPDDRHTTLLEQNNLRVDSNDDINNRFSTDPIVKTKITDTSVDMPRDSTFSVSSEHISVTNSFSEMNHGNDYCNLDLINVPLRRLKQSKKNHSDPSLPQTTNRSSYHSFESPYIVALKERERKFTDIRK
jgi:uncharacterized protein YpmS